ncbi:Methyltransferase domain protein [Roseovarius albus]|uniref:Methyltransferase domain protein n=1 Tax=Roseovarius albus TaxID=1247867 RepID=A0A1X6ZV73_9RHOB|nr:methyltransferase domain-containing protein [Roseovarius albus]SLN62016.1 Methyltransferase domain protein [Roseovarius albus]
MKSKSKGQTLLENAYKLATPTDNKAYYNEFAETYDAEFANALGWEYPNAIATVYRENADSDHLPIADIGCGTGLVAEALGFKPDHIDGIDISEEMLATPRKKSLYRKTIQADLMGDHAPIKNDYGAVVSAGTFTSGHVGPDPLERLLDIGRSGALFVIGVNRAFYLEAGFDPVIRDLEARGSITDLRVTEVPMYNKAGHDHSSDKAFALCYRKRPSD